MTNWFCRDRERYDTAGASLRLTPSGWVLFWPGGDRPHARGRYRALDDAMDAWDRIRRTRDAAD